MVKYPDNRKDTRGIELGDYVSMMDGTGGTVVKMWNPMINGKPVPRVWIITAPHGYAYPVTEVVYAMGKGGGYD